MWLLVSANFLLTLPWFISKSEIHSAQFGGEMPTVPAALSGVLGLTTSTVLIIWSFWPFEWWQPLVAGVLGSLIAGIVGALLGRTRISGVVAVLSFSAGAGLAWRIFTN